MNLFLIWWILFNSLLYWKVFLDNEWMMVVDVGLWWEMVLKIGSCGRFVEVVEEDMVVVCMVCLRKVGVGEEMWMCFRRDGRGMGCGGGEGGKEKKDRVSLWVKEGDGWRLRMEMLCLCGEDEDVSCSESGGCL